MYLLWAAGERQEEESEEVPKFLVPFLCGLFLPFPSLSASASILKESGKHYFVIRGSFSLHTCWMTLQPSEIQVYC
jgi:hypothetical protein